MVSAVFWPVLTAEESVKIGRFAYFLYTKFITIIFKVVDIDQDGVVDTESVI